MLLYIILIHHQTTTAGTAFAESHPLYIIFIHHQTTTVRVRWYSPGGCISSLFITKPQQQFQEVLLRFCCISSLFITKPQLDVLIAYTADVVSHPYSSPNHNIRHTLISLCLLYLILIHHQTTTVHGGLPMPVLLYLILIHHQTTTLSG